MLKVTQIKREPQGRYSLTIEREMEPGLVLTLDELDNMLSGYFEQLNDIASALFDRPFSLNLLKVATKNGSDIVSVKGEAIINVLPTFIEAKDLLLSQYEPRVVVYDELSKPNKDIYNRDKVLFEMRLIWLKINDYVDENLQRIAKIHKQMRMFDTDNIKITTTQAI